MLMLVAILIHRMDMTPVENVPILTIRSVILHSQEKNTEDLVLVGYSPSKNGKLKPQVAPVVSQYNRTMIYTGARPNETFYAYIAEWNGKLPKRIDDLCRLIRMSTWRYFPHTTISPR